MNIIEVIKILSIFVVLFPLVMAIVWSVGGLFHQLKYNEKLSEEDLELEEQKFIILVPVFNEEKEIKKHVEELLKLNYSNYELWVLDDCSTDNSYSEINKVKDSKLICHKNKKNLGKAATLNKILDKIDTEYFLVIDSDTMVDINILKKLNCEIKKDQKEDNNKYAGYTGNVTVYGEKEDRNLIIQKIEYRTFIDMIKRSQMILFKSVMTLSGACSCYKTDVIRTIGKFNEKNATEDIEISWRLNQEGYKLKYLENIHAKVLTPENIYDLVEQRKRWTIGLLQTVVQNFSKLFTLKNNRLKFFVLESIISGLWAISFFVVTIFYIFVIFTKQFLNIKIINFIPATILIFAFSLMLSLIAYSIAQEREKLKVFLRHYLWFPFLYFVIQPIAFIKGLNEYIFMKQDGKWRKRSKEKSRYLFSTIVDVFATFVVINIAMHILDDKYTIFQNYELVKQVIFFLILKAGYVILYYTKIRFGEKLVDRSYPLFLNISFYLIIISFIDNFIRIINYEARTLSQKNYFVISEIKLFVYTVGIIILYNVFKNIIDKKNNDD